MQFYVFLLLVLTWVYLFPQLSTIQHFQSAIRKSFVKQTIRLKRVLHKDKYPDNNLDSLMTRQVIPHEMQSRRMVMGLNTINSLSLSQYVVPALQM
jgi:hypothetical protein